MRLSQLITLVALLCLAACHPRPVSLGPTTWQPFEHWQIVRKHEPDIDAYVAKTEHARPLILFAQGSKCLPLFMIAEQRQVSAALFVSDVGTVLDRVHFAVIERRGLESFTPPPSSEAAAQLAARCTASHGGVSKQERVRDLVDTALALHQQPWVSSVFLLGHSEGADVVAGAAALLGPEVVAGVGLLSGAGATRFFDDLLISRRSGDDGEAKQILDDIIDLTTEDRPSEYRGAPVDRQITYAIESTPLDDLREVDVPIFVASGTRDAHVPIEAADLCVAELLRDPKREVRYVILPGMDHGYYDEAGQDRSLAVLEAFIDWALAPDKGRDVWVGLPAP